MSADEMVYGLSTGSYCRQSKSCGQIGVDAAMDITLQRLCQEIFLTGS